VKIYGNTFYSSIPCNNFFLQLKKKTNPQEQPHKHQQQKSPPFTLADTRANAKGAGLRWSFCCFPSLPFCCFFCHAFCIHALAAHYFFQLKKTIKKNKELHQPTEQKDAPIKQPKAKLHNTHYKTATHCNRTKTKAVSYNGYYVK
jgi:hypothetical protein